MHFFEDIVTEAGPDVKIHPTAMVARGAELAKGVSIGPRAIVGSKVELSEGVIVGAGAIVDGRTSVGSGTTIYPYATVGSTPQDLKYGGEDAQLIIGRDNRIREYANISIGTEGGGGKTVIGDRNLLMVYTHLAHDVIVGDDCIFANSVQIAGHCIIGNHTVFGGLSGVHQFCRFGDYVMVGAASLVVQDVPPYCLVQGDRAAIHGLNVVGLRRAKISGDELSAIKSMYRLLYSSNLSLEAAQSTIEQEVADTVHRKAFLKFLAESERGVCR